MVKPGRDRQPGLGHRGHAGHGVQQLVVSPLLLGGRAGPAQHVEGSRVIAGLGLEHGQVGQGVRLQDGVPGLARERQSLTEGRLLRVVAVPGVLGQGDEHARPRRVRQARRHQVQRGPQVRGDLFLAAVPAQQARVSSSTAARAGSAAGSIRSSAAAAYAAPFSFSPAVLATAAACSSTLSWLAPMRCSASGTFSQSSRTRSSRVSCSAWARARPASAAARQLLTSAQSVSCAAYQWCACSITARPGGTSPGSASSASANRECSRVWSLGSRSSRIASRMRPCRNA